MDDNDRIVRPRIDPSRTPFTQTAAFRRYGLTTDPDPDSLEALYTKAVVEEQGFDGPPHVVTRRQLDRYVSSGEIELYRGVTQQGFADQLRCSGFFVGRGGELDGMYAAAGPSALAVARSYAARGDGTVVRMTLRRGARVTSWRDVERQSALEYRTMVPVPPEVARTLYNDPGRLIAYLGFDAVHVVDFPETDHYMVLNRTALRVQWEDAR
ncbi:MAG: hypothetical protein ACRDJE_08905 [Dehalococcoidia bacterium]